MKTSTQSENILEVEHKSKRAPSSSGAPLDLTDGVIWKTLAAFTLPILCSSLFQQLYNTVGAAVLGMHCGSQELAAVGSTGSLINLTIGLFMGISSGASVCVARLWGARDENVSRAVHTAFVLSIICGVLLTGLGIVVCRPLLVIMKFPSELIDMSAEYLIIYFTGMVPSMVYNIGAGILRAVGDSRRPLIHLVISGVINVIVTIILVVGFDMGVAGAAWATVVSLVAAAVLTVGRLFRTRLGYRLTLKGFCLDGGIVREIIRIGIPTGVQSMLYAITNMMIQTGINVFGADAMAGTAAYYKLDGLQYLPINSISIAIMTFTAQNMGANKPERVRQGIRSALIMGFGCSLFTAMLWVIFGRPLLTMLTGGNVTAVHYGYMMLLCMAPLEWTFVPTEVLGGVIRGAGAVLMSTLLTALFICVIRITILSAIMPLINNILVVFLTYPISWSICSTAFIIYYKKGHWMYRRHR